MQLVDDRVLARRVRRARRRLVWGIGHRPREQAAARNLPARAPGPAARERPRGRIEQDLGRIVAVAWLFRTVDLVTVAELVRQAGDPDVPVVARAVPRRIERNLGVDQRAAR